jgi:hypothetical protein
MWVPGCGTVRSAAPPTIDFRPDGGTSHDRSGQNPSCPYRAGPAAAHCAGRAWSTLAVALAVATRGAASSGDAVIDEIVAQQLVPPNYDYVEFMVFLVGQNIPSQVTVHYATRDEQHLPLPVGDAMLQFDNSGGGVLTLASENLSGTAVVVTLVVTYADQSSASPQYDHSSTDVPARPCGRLIKHPRSLAELRSVP